MIVKIKLGEIKMLMTGLKKLVDKELPIKTAYKLSKIIQIINTEFVAFEAARGKLVKKYAVEGEDEKGDVKVDPKNEKKFFEEFLVLLDNETEINVDLISVEDLGNISITPGDMLSIQKIIDEKKE